MLFLQSWKVVRQGEQNIYTVPNLKSDTAYIVTIRGKIAIQDKTYVTHKEEVYCVTGEISVTRMKNFFSLKPSLLPFLLKRFSCFLRLLSLVFCRLTVFKINLSASDSGVANFVSLLCSSALPASALTIRNNTEQKNGSASARLNTVGIK